MQEKKLSYFSLFIVNFASIMMFVLIFASLFIYVLIKPSAANFGIWAFFTITYLLIFILTKSNFEWDPEIDLKELYKNLFKNNVHIGEEWKHKKNYRKSSDYPFKLVPVFSHLYRLSALSVDKPTIMPNKTFSNNSKYTLGISGQINNADFNMTDVEYS